MIPFFPEHCKAILIYYVNFFGVIRSFFNFKKVVDKIMHDGYNNTCCFAARFAVVAELAYAHV